MYDTCEESMAPSGGEPVACGEEAVGQKVCPPVSGVEAVRVSNGYYVLRSGTGERVLDIAGNSSASEANAQLYHPNGTAAQIFGVAWDSDAKAMVICHGDQYLRGAGDDGTGNACQSADGGTAAQRWAFEPVCGEDGWFYVRNLCGYYLDVDNACDMDCANVKCWEFNGSPAQRWRLTRVSGVPMVRIPDGEYVLRSCIGKRVLDIEGDGATSQANARLGRPRGGASQVFGVEWDKRTGSTIIRHGGMCLDKAGGDGTGNVWQFEDNGTKAQRWIFEPVPGEDDRIFIRDAYGYYLGVEEAEDEGGLNVACQDFDGSAAQQWGLGIPTLAYATVTLSESAFAYTGEEIEPAVTVTLGSMVLERDIDYDVTYKDNDKAGTATVKVAGRGVFMGSAKTTFEIVATSLEGATVTPKKASLEYTGKAVRPKVAVTLGDEVLERGTDYAVTYIDNTEVGTATVTITGKGNYEGSASATFEIVPARVSVKKAKVTPEEPCFRYTGEAIEPDLCVTLNDVTLVRDVDYDVSYDDNTEVGTATVAVTGKGAYKGTARAHFKIAPLSLKKATVTPEEESVPYTGKPIRPRVTVTLGDATLTEGTDYAVSYFDNTHVGTAAIKVAGKGMYKGSAKATFTIAPASLKGASVDFAKPSHPCTGKPVKPKATVTVDGTTLEKGSDYTISFEDNVSIGTAVATLTGKGDYEGTATATFEIVPAKVRLTKAASGGKDVTVAWEAEPDVDGYQVQCAADSEFTQVKKAVDVLMASSTSVRVTDLGKGVCHVRVRSYKDVLATRLYSPWCPPKKAKGK